MQHMSLQDALCHITTTFCTVEQVMVLAQVNKHMHDSITSNHGLFQSMFDNCYSNQLKQLQNKVVTGELKDPSLAIDIWDEQPNLAETSTYSSPGDIRHYTINKFIDLCTCSSGAIIRTWQTPSTFKHDPMAEAAMLLDVYANYMKPVDLLLKLIQKYRGHQDAHIDDLQDSRLLVLRIIKLWVSQDFIKEVKDCNDTEALNLLRTFIFSIWHTTSDAISPSGLFYAFQIPDFFLASLQKHNNYLKDQVHEINPESLLSLQPAVIADILTSLDISLQATISRSELLRYTTRALNPKSIQVKRYLGFWKSVNHWTVDSVLQCEGLKQRTQTVQKIIEIADCLIKAKSFFTLSAIYAALSNASVHRLRFTWGKISKKHLEMNDQVARVMSSTAAYRALRDTEGNSCIPGLSIYLTDLTFISDGNPDFVHGNALNRRKILLVTRTLSQYFSKSQRFAGAYKPYKGFEGFLSQIQASPTDETDDSERKLYERSLQLEPRGCSRKDLVK